MKVEPHHGAPQVSTASAPKYNTCSHSNAYTNLCMMPLQSLAHLDQRVDDHPNDMMYIITCYHLNGLNCTIITRCNEYYQSNSSESARCCTRSASTTRHEYTRCTLHIDANTWKIDALSYLIMITAAITA